MGLREDNYVHIAGWMYMLGLDKLNELIAFAIVHGFSQDGETKYKGGLSYIAELLMCDKRTAMRVMTTLEEKGLVEKTQKEINGVKFNRYSVPAGVVKICHQWCQNVTGGSENLSHKNTNKEYISSNIPTINNLDNITTKETSKESCDVEHVEIEELIYSWLINDEQIRRMQFFKLGLIKKETTKEEFETILREYITKYYEKCRLDGEADIRERGHNRVMSHFNNWLSKFKRLQDYEKEKQEFTNQKPKRDGWNKQDFLAALNS